MKIRTGFVSNSSSSSFVAFCDLNNDELVKTLCSAVDNEEDDETCVDTLKRKNELVLFGDIGQHSELSLLLSKLKRQKSIEFYCY